MALLFFDVVQGFRCRDYENRTQRRDFMQNAPVKMKFRDICVISLIRYQKASKMIQKSLETIKNKEKRHINRKKSSNTLQNHTKQ